MKDNINSENLPQHIAVIMDGNGRWAKKKGARRVFGHKNAVKAVRDVTEASAELGIKYLTLYAFSTENWSRPKAEVEALMKLLVSTIRKEVKTLVKNNVKLQSIGNRNDLPKVCQRELAEAIELTKDHTGLTLTLALSYSGRWDIVNAVKDIAHDVKSGKVDPGNIDTNLFSKYLSTDSMPDPELMIRTSG